MRAPGGSPSVSIHARKLPLVVAAAALAEADRRAARTLVALARARALILVEDALPDRGLRPAERQALDAALADDERLCSLSARLSSVLDDVPSDDRLVEWARENGVESLLGLTASRALSLESKHGLQPLSVPGRASRSTLTVGDVASGRFRARADMDALAELRLRGDVLLRARRLVATEAVARELWSAARCERADGALQELHDRLRAALQDEDVSALPTRGGDAQLDDGRLCWRAGNVEVSVALGAVDHGVKVTCSCANDACAHRAEGAAAVLDLLAHPSDDERAVLQRQLGRPGWQRLLLALDEEDAKRAADDGSLAWELRGARSPTLQPRAQPRGPSLGEIAGGDVGAPPDRACARLLLADQKGEAVGDALLALVGHPRVYLDDGSAPVAIERGYVELMVEDHDDGALSLRVGVDGEPLPADAALDERGPLLLVQAERGRVLVVERDRTTNAVAQVVRDLPARIPPSARFELLRRLPRLESRMPVRLPDALVGEEIPAQPKLVLRLLPAPNVVLKVQAGLVPVGGAAWLAPGEGPLKAAGVHEGRRVTAVRARAEEPAYARGILDELPLPPEAAPWTWLLDEEEQALLLLAALSGRDDVTSEWPDGRALFEPPREASVSDVIVRVKRGRDWFSVGGGLRVNEEAVGLNLLLEVVRDGRRFVRVDERRWMSLSEDLRARLRGAANALYPFGDDLRVGRPAAPLLDELLGDEIEDEEAAEAWRALVARARLAKDAEPTPPAALNASLRPYQHAGFAWLARVCEWAGGGVLADEMGLGKTVQTITALLHRAENGPTLVVAPTSVCFNWRREIERFAPTLRVRLMEGSGRSGALQDLGPGDVVIASYGVVVNEIDAFARVKLATVVFDEAQALKNPAAQRTRAIRRLQADARIAISGTPVENHLGELWSLFSVVLPGLLGPWPAFFKRFAAPIERDNDDEAREALLSLLAPFLLRRTKDEVAKDLPERIEISLPIELSEEERALYEAARRRAESDIAAAAVGANQEQARIRLLASLTRLRRLCCHPKLDDPDSPVASTKLLRCLRLVDDIVGAGSRALLFSQFTSHLRLVEEAIKERGVPVLYLDGTTPAEERARRVDAFQRGEAPVFLISLKAGGAGLNLTAADYVLHLDPWWNPAVEDQATDRAHRIGQTRPVTVYRLVAAGTIEERVLEMHDEKRALANDVLQGATGALDVNRLASLLTPSA